MSDEAPKVEPVPCAWCGKEPRAKQHYAFPERTDYDCRTEGCFENYGSSLWEWNAKQARILAARKLDFEAGFNQGYCKGNNLDDHRPIAEYFEQYLARGKE